MCVGNQTVVTEFLLLGFRGIYKYKLPLFIVFLFSYLVILIGNLLIIVLVSTNDDLKIPMFIFLKHLAIADVLITTTIMPMMLDIIVVDEKRVSVSGCLAQLYLFFISGFVQCFLIAIMSYDRYLAICCPMRYHSMMYPQLCLKMVLGSWSLIFFLSCESYLVLQLEFCGHNAIDHFFCDFRPVVKLATSDTTLLALVDFSSSLVVFITPFALIIMSYIWIFFTIMTLPSTSGRRKAFSTCSSHLATVFLYYGTLMMVYMEPWNDSSFSTNKFKSLLYVVVTPMMNPIIYSLRNPEIRRTLQQIVRRLRDSN
ncbi:olfactory receptor 10A3-like [Eleutherodactylus coqui]|uniref:olfactory receptor 10A3-like n=1 Tax=Eleutherodactylus coqui TaxID=57060 RepID=UPI003462974E